MSRTLGFTFIELLVVLGILAVITIVAAPFLASSVSRNNLQTSAWTLVDDLRRAQVQSMAAQSNSPWGVHLQTDRHVFFLGATYNASDPDNITTMLPATITMSVISLNGGGADVRFTKVKGDTADYGSITLTDSSSDETVTISVNAVGHIE